MVRMCMYCNELGGAFPATDPPGWQRLDSEYKLEVKRSGGNKGMLELDRVLQLLQ